MSRLSRQEYHPYNQQTHQRWSPSPPPNRLSSAIDPRMASRMAPQEMQQQQATQMSQLAPPLVSAASHAELVQAVNAMSAQVTAQLSMVGAQLTSLVSLTSRLIETSRLSTDAAVRGKAPLDTNGNNAFAPTNRADNAHAVRSNGAPDSSSLASANVNRPDARTPFYNMPQTNYRNTIDPSTSSMGAALREVSLTPPPSFTAMTSGINGRPTHDPEDIHRSRLPSPVFPDDPLDMSADLSASTQQTPKRTSTGGAPDSARKHSVDASLGDWKVWLNRSWMPPPGHNSRAIQFRSMQDARRAHRDQTKRSMATLGRLPLKEFLEIKPEQYLEVRKSGRKLYQEWLLQEVRLAKQPEDRVKAAVNKLEADHPELGDCEDHWKARQLLQQIIDNAIDEANLNRRRVARTSTANKTVTDTPTRATAANAARTTAAAPPSSTAQRSAKEANSAATRAGQAAPPAAAIPAGATKAAKAGTRRKADQAELDTTPTRNRQPPSQRATMVVPNHDPTSASMQAHASLSSSGLDYSNQYSDNGGLPSTGADVTRQHSQHSHHSQHANQHSQHPSHQHQPQHHTQAQQEHTQNAWANPNATAASTLFGQSNYVTPQTMSHHAQQQSQSQHSQYQSHGAHSAHHPSSQYMSSGPSAGIGQGGMGSQNSGMLDDQRHHPNLSPLVHSGNVRMQQSAAGQPQATFFDYRHHQP